MGIQINPRFELATQLVNNDGETLTKSIFDAIVQEICKGFNLTLADDVQERVWSKVKTQHIADTQTKLIDAFANQILSPLTPAEISLVLQTTHTFFSLETQVSVLLRILQLKDEKYSLIATDVSQAKVVGIAETVLATLQEEKVLK